MDTADDDADNMSAMYGDHSPWQVPEFPPVTPGPDHAVLHQVTSNEGDQWDSDHVRMPFSDKSCLQQKAPTGPAPQPRWNLIKKALTARPIANSTDLARAIVKYNVSYESKWKFAALHKFFNKHLKKNESDAFFKSTLPKIIDLALELDQLVKAPIPLLKQHMNMSISMSQQQVASLLANAFLCTFPRRNTTGPGSEFANYPQINFTPLYERVDLTNTMEKLACVINYFTRVTNATPTGVVTFTRRAVDKRDWPRWDASPVPISSVPIYVDDQLTIEDAAGLIQVVFANKKVGGEGLHVACAQEQIRFMICPELIVSMLFTEKLEADEAFVVIGCERFTKCKGYGSQFRFDGDFVDDTPTDGSGRRRAAVLAVDALQYHDTKHQFQSQAVLRELNKAWIGFSYDTGPLSPNLRYPGVATGNWGCGAFGGAPQLKSLLQLMACAQARRPMAYLSFGDAKVKGELIAVFNMLKRHQVTVGQLYGLILNYCKSSQKVYLHKYLDQELNKPQNSSGGSNPRNNATSGTRVSGYPVTSRSNNVTRGTTASGYSAASRSNNVTRGTTASAYSETSPSNAENLSRGFYPLKKVSRTPGSTPLPLSPPWFETDVPKNTTIGESSSSKNYSGIRGANTSSNNYAVDSPTAANASPNKNPGNMGYEEIEGNISGNTANYSAYAANSANPSPGNVTATKATPSSFYNAAKTSAYIYTRNNPGNAANDPASRANVFNNNNPGKESAVYLPNVYYPHPVYMAATKSSNKYLANQTFGAKATSMNYVAPLTAPPHTANRNDPDLEETDDTPVSNLSDLINYTGLSEDLGPSEVPNKSIEANISNSDAFKKDQESKQIITSNNALVSRSSLPNNVVVDDDWSDLGDSDDDTPMAVETSDLPGFLNVLGSRGMMKKQLGTAENRRHSHQGNPSSQAEENTLPFNAAPNSLTSESNPTELTNADEEAKTPASHLLLAEGNEPESSLEENELFDVTASERSSPQHAYWSRIKYGGQHSEAPSSLTHVSWGRNPTSNPNIGLSRPQSYKVEAQSNSEVPSTHTHVSWWRNPTSNPNIGLSRPQSYKVETQRTMAQSDTPAWWEESAPNNGRQHTPQFTTPETLEMPRTSSSAMGSRRASSSKGKGGNLSHKSLSRSP